MRETRRRFVPAAGHDWLLPLYDPLQKLLGADSMRRELIDQAELRPGHRVLDLGCGTGALSLQLKRLHPGVEVTGLDPDPKALARAEAKARRQGLAVRFDRGFGDDLPYPEARFDRVVSSLVLHHLKPEEKRATLAEARRVLVPGGSLHVLDFGGATARSDGLLARLLHGNELLADGFEGRIPAMLSEARFSGAKEVGHRTTLLGRIARFRADVPG